MRIYNTMSRKKEELVPIHGKDVNIYCCGPTVYNLIHVGNARQLCVFDVLRRYLKYRGYNVKYIQNFTDVDDKIIRIANEKGISPFDHAEEMIKEYFKDARGLNIADADIHPKATESIDIILEMVKKLIDKGYAYQSGNDVYFSAGKDENYGKLSHMPLDELREGASQRVDGSEQKKDPMDFAVWKGAKEGEPYWDSPYGKGRPGWHIECSAMSSHYVGGTLDIHGGGADLIFPHHENEIAQSECANGYPLANLWMHNGMLNVDNRKMSKSKGNFFLVRDLSEKFGYEPIRFMLLSAQYRAQLNYTLEVMESAVASLDRLKTCKRALEKALETARQGETSQEIADIAQNRKQQFIDAMDDDLNTADGITAVFELVREINTAILDENNTKGSLEVLKKTFDELTDVLGILFEKEEEIPAEILELVEKRKEARKNKDFALADSIRDEITAKGYIVEETRQGVNIKKA
ncbi:MAG: cysteine--tRNA ligase [Ruminococcaceae bacterium]|nr:cysteine--tRNA ligase [Oscillospiraceae bacterium]